MTGTLSKGDVLRKSVELENCVSCLGTGVTELFAFAESAISSEFNQFAFLENDIFTYLLVNLVKQIIGNIHIGWKANGKGGQTIK